MCLDNIVLWMLIAEHSGILLTFMATFFIMFGKTTGIPDNVLISCSIKPIKSTGVTRGEGLF